MSSHFYIWRDKLTSRMCSVVSCDSWRRSAQRYKLPEDPERRLEWVQFLFEVNGQRFKESSWTDITICSEHFTEDCFDKLTLETGMVQLKFSAVPSVCIKSEPQEPETHQEPVVKTEVTSQCDELIAHDSPSSCSEESGLTSRPAPESPMPSDTSAFMSDYSQMLQKIANLDIIREKAALLQKKGAYIVSENKLLQLFSRKCPLCGSKVKVEKFAYGVLLILNQQCLECEYRDQWKSQANASVPGDQQLTGGIDVTPETEQTVSADDSRSATTGDSEESDLMDESEEPSDEDDMDSDEDWSLESDAEIEVSELCTECGMFFNKRKSHMCEHKIKPYLCNICGKRCGTQSALSCHIRIHNEDYEHPCKYCHVTFKTKLDKLSHEATHLTQEKPYKCPDCSETFATYKQCGVHLEDHRGPRQLKCHICGIEFDLPKGLKRHLAVHTGEKRYKCSVCQRGFKQASHLKSHIRLHTGARPYRCQHCDKCFNHNVSLKSHVQRYHSSSSGLEQKKGKKHKTVSDTVDDRESGNKKGTNSDLEHVGEHDDEEEEVQKVGTDVPKSKAGKPIGRPKRNAVSCTKTAKGKVRKLKTKRYSDEESEDELTESDMSFDSAEEEEHGSERVTPKTSRSRGRQKHSDSDSDFHPEGKKKKRFSSQNTGEGSGKRRGRPRKNQVEEDV